MTPLTGMWRDLQNRSVALVYSFPKRADPPNRWYDRWKTRVIMSYGEALERIQVRPFYCDIDSFCQKVFSNQLPDCDAVISLNAGVRPLSLFALVPSVAQWGQIPIIPCTADVIIAGERKDLGNHVAQQLGLVLPTTYTRRQIEKARQEESLIIKPRDLGGSVGMKRITGADLQESDFSFGRIVQRFISGYDVTIPIFVDVEAGHLIIGDATVYVPSGPKATDWIYDREAKESYVGGATVASVSRLQFPLQSRATEKIRDFAQAIGVDSFARVDFRLTIAELGELECIKADQLTFIEINPMPTVCTGLAFVEGVRSWVIRRWGDQPGAMGSNLDPKDDFDIIAFVLANALSGQLGPAKVNDRDQIGS